MSHDLKKHQRVLFQGHQATVLNFQQLAPDSWRAVVQVDGEPAPRSIDPMDCQHFPKLHLVA